MKEFFQIFPRKYCLSCIHCCRFRSAHSIWRPKVLLDDFFRSDFTSAAEPYIREGVDESRSCKVSPKPKSLKCETTKAISARMQGYKNFIRPDGYLKVRRKQGRYSCVFWDDRRHKCKIYETRPFECRLYPFIISRTKKKLLLYLHLSCPFIQEKLGSKKLEDYQKYLLKYFQTEKMQGFLKKNFKVFNDYSRYAKELLLVSEIEGEW